VRAGGGGNARGAAAGAEYHAASLPAVARAGISGQCSVVSGQEQERKPEGRSEALWTWFKRLSEKKKTTAAARLRALDAIEALVRGGTSRTTALTLIARQECCQVSSLYEWEKATAPFDRSDWLPALAPRHMGGGKEAECSAEAWAFIRADFLRPEEPAFAACYRRLAATARGQGWVIPSPKTLERRLLALPMGVRMLGRVGTDKLKRMYPAQVRDRSVFHALEAVNADGHRFDVFVRWPDGEIGRPVMLAFQDLYSGKVLSWRVDRSEHKGLVRLAFGDVVERFGIPELCWLDNGRAFASKWLTGRTPNRFRFTVKDDEPAGIMTLLGVSVHWTTPYAGQSKPIERAFKDLAEDVSRHPALAGAYTGNDPLAKPENYGSRAVPIDQFLAVLASGIAEHNARSGRRTAVANGRSFDATFTESYERSVIRRAATAQRELFLLAAEGVSVGRVDGVIQLAGNRYWAPELHDFMGKRVTVRFDPDALHDDLRVYRMDGPYLCAAECIEAAGFADATAAREHARRRNSWLKGERMKLDAERKMTIAEVAALLPKVEETPAPPPKLVRLVNGANAVAAAPAEQPESEQQWMRGLAKLRLATEGGELIGEEE
jgi:putative transposase